MLSREYLNWKPSSKSTTAAKREEKEKKERWKKERPNDQIFQKFDFCTCPSKKGLKCNAGGKEGMLSSSKILFH